MTIGQCRTPALELELWVFSYYVPVDSHQCKCRYLGNQQERSCKNSFCFALTNRRHRFGNGDEASPPFVPNFFKDFVHISPPRGCAFYSALAFSLSAGVKMRGTASKATISLMRIQLSPRIPRNWKTFSWDSGSAKTSCKAVICESTV